MKPRTWVLALAAVFAVLQLAGVTGRDTPDSKNYVSYALDLRGDSKRESAAAAIDWTCAGRASIARRKQSVDPARFHAPDPTARVTDKCRDELWREVDKRLRAGQTGGHIAPFANERFMQIFEVRPGYPMLLVPFITLFGVTWGVWLASVLMAVAGGVLAFLVLRTLGAPPVVALTGQALFYVLPCGTTAMRPMTEGLMLALTLSALWGCALAVEGRARAGAALIGGSLVLLFAVKHSQAMFLALCLAGACAVTAVRRRELDRPRLLIGSVAVGGALATVVAAWLLHYPSSSDSVQDLLTHHYNMPDRARPWPEFLHLEANFWVEWLRRQFWEPLFLTALVAGAWGVVRQRPAFAGFLFAAAGTGFLTHAAHPNITIWGGRLIVLAWLLPVIGLPLLLERVMGARAAGAVTEPGLSGRDTRSPDEMTRG
ncbi:ArnT family glycosyltransferase [Streptomyces acidicola]|uniref:ArnT family glycosyltransferase n=1 Tax=Streptomyces acidicola TaxID=2596892 RepID=UPI0037F16237